MKNVIHFLGLFLFIISCTNSNEKLKSKIENDSNLNAGVDTDINLNIFSKSDVARFAISAIMGRPAKTVNVKEENGLFVVSYNKNGDSNKYIYKVKIDQDKILWANIDGRWRDTEFDEKISFEESSNKLKITQKYSDGSVTVKEFKMGE